MLTIKDIAKAAGVSHGTVSNVLNKKGCVSSKKIRLVEQTAKAMGYHIDEQASLLRKGATRTIAIILPDVESIRYAQLYTSIINTLEKYSCNTKLFLTNDLPYIENQAIETAIAIKACAIITVSCLYNTEKYYKIPQLEKINVLFVERVAMHKSGYITFDYTNIGKEVAQLINNNNSCCNIIVFSGNTHYSDNQSLVSAMSQTYSNNKNVEYIEIISSEISNIILKNINKYKDKILIASNETIAVQLIEAFHLISDDTPPEIISISSTRTLQDNRFTHFNINYQNLGFKAANAIIDAIDSGKKLPKLEIGYEKPKVKHINEAKEPVQKLKVVALESPSAEALKNLCGNFEKDTGIKVEIETYPLSTIYDSILENEDLKWDVIRLDVSSLSFLAPKLFLPLNIVDKNIERYFDELLPALKENYSRVNDIFYAIPFDISVQMLFYRKDLFENFEQQRNYFEKFKKPLCVPKTYEDYIQVAKFFTRCFNPMSPTLYGTSIALGTPTSTTSEFLPRLLSSGELKFNHEKLKLSSKQSIAALQNHLECAKYADPSAVYSWSEIADAFAEGETATAILFVNHACKIINAQNSSIAGTVDFATIPGEAPLLGGGSLGIYKNSKQPQAAYSFIKWATGSDIALELMSLGGISPSLKAYEYTKALKTYPWLANLPDNIKIGARKNLFVKNNSQFDQHEFEHKLGELLIDAIKNRKSIEESLESAQKLLEEFEEM